MGLASKVQAAGGAAGASAARPPIASGATAQSAASAFPQINQGPGGQGMPQASFPGQQGAVGQPGFPGQQSSAARPSFPNQPSFAGQQPLQPRPGQPPMQGTGFSGQQQQHQPFQQAGFPGGQPGQGPQSSYAPGQPQQMGQQQMGQQPGQGAQQSYLQGQPQQMGQQVRPSQQPSSFGQGVSSHIQGALQSKIQNMISTNRLEAFYPPNKLQAVVQRLGQIDWK